MGPWVKTHVADNYFYLILKTKQYVNANNDNFVDFE